MAYRSSGCQRWDVPRYGTGSTQAAAEAQALAGLNAMRKHRYAGTSSIPVDGNSFTDNGVDHGARGTTLTLDVN